MILFGFSNLQTWGPLVARDDAPFSLVRLSPAPLFIVVGIVLGQAFFAWSHRRVAADKCGPVLSPASRCCSNGTVQPVPT